MTENKQGEKVYDLFRWKAPPKTGSTSYQAYWDGRNDNPHRKYVKGSTLYYAWLAGVHKRKKITVW